MVRSVMTKSRKMTFGSNDLDEKATLKDSAAGRKQVIHPSHLENKLPGVLEAVLNSRTSPSSSSMPASLRPSQMSL